ncbi:hypothetical protein AB0G67_47680 [Streptomyces sp. NPDC021056]|uniref:hypothetical protein n=1 Tax=Streptomyces sp. NPDC021056 TaxID=3155012 RepID=UPI0033EA564E
MATYDYPDDLLNAQRDLTRVRADLAALLNALPYSVEPMEAWARPEGCWLATARARPHSPGWTEAEQQQVAELRDREREMAIAIVTHDFWVRSAPTTSPGRAMPSSTPSNARTARARRRRSRASPPPSSTCAAQFCAWIRRRRRVVQRTGRRL